MRPAPSPRRRLRRPLLTGALSLAAGVLLLAASAAAAPLKVDSDGNKLFDDLESRITQSSPGQKLDVIVVLHEPATQERVAGLERAVGGFDVKRRYTVIDGFAAKVPAAAVRRLASLPVVQHVESDSVVHALNDTSEQAFGVTQARLDAPGLDGNADGNLATYSPGDLVAAVIDTGIDTGHLDLDQGKVIGWTDFVNARATPYDDNGHGTHVSATIAGDGDARPDRLHQGVAPGAALVGVKVLDQNGNGSTSNVIAGIQWAVQNKALYGIEALNLSLGVSGCSDGADAASLAINSAADSGLVPAVAAGNEGPGTCTVGSPGAAAKALTVGAMADLASNGFYEASFSSRGPTFDGRIKPDISSPGVNIVSAQAGTTNGYVTESGTSMATPFTAGVALLMLDQNPSLTPQQVKDDIMQTAVDWGRGGNNMTAGTTGPDSDFGAGRLDAYAAIHAAGAPISTPPPVPDHVFREGTLTSTIRQINYSIPVRDTAFPIAATMIIPAITGASGSPDFDLYLYAPGVDPNNSQSPYLARAFTTSRQETISYKPTVTGNYTLSVKAYQSSVGDYFVDISEPPVSYSFPVGASPSRISLVPSFAPCASANATHAAPFSTSSCSPPVPQSSLVATGPSSVGFARLVVLGTGSCAPFDPTHCAPDVTIKANITDVRSGSPSGGDYDTPSAQDLTLAATLPDSGASTGSGYRITDQYSKLTSGYSYDRAATTGALPFPVPLSCTPTSDPALGSTCSAQTTANTLVPGAVVSGKRAVWEIGRLEVLDNGVNGVAGDSDDKTFEAEGVFSP